LLNRADARSADDLSELFDFTQKPLTFTQVSSDKPLSFLKERDARGEFGTPDYWNGPGAEAHVALSPSCRRRSASRDVSNPASTDLDTGVRRYDEYLDAVLKIEM
jgi:hypothetical protein